MSETETWYLVQTFRPWSSVTVLGLPLAGEKDAPGCVGFLPVFDSLDAAKAWRMEHGHQSAGIVPMQAATTNNYRRDSAPPTAASQGGSISGDGDSSPADSEWNQGG